MVILAILYGFLILLVFGMVKLARWGWLSGTVAMLIGAAILGSFLALLNTYAPSGPIVASGRVVEVTPTVRSQALPMPAAMSVPPDAEPGLLRLSVLGKATVVAQDASATGAIAGVLLDQCVSRRPVTTARCRCRPPKRDVLGGTSIRNGDDHDHLAATPHHRHSLLDQKP